MAILDDLRRLFADAEVSLVGGREERQEAERALADGEWFRARKAAHRLLERAPRSPVGLALLADACEGAGLDAELEDSLAALARLAGASADVWLRLGKVRARVGARPSEIRQALVAAVSFGDDPTPSSRLAAREARLALVDLELAEGEAARAEGWLMPLVEEGAAEGNVASDVRRRRIAVAVARRAREETKRLLDEGGFDPAVTDASGQMLIGRAAELVGDRDLAVRSLARATILGEDAAIAPLREALASGDGLSAMAVRAAEAVADARGVTHEPLWRAALASARGDAAAAASALREAMAGGSDSAAAGGRAVARALAVAARDALLLGRVADGPVDAAILDASRVLSSADDSLLLGALDALSAAESTGPDANTSRWMTELRRGLVARLLPIDRPAQWEPLLARLHAQARALADLESMRKLELLAAERGRPVRLAIVGEFNAGKSTFVNALLGMDVAPTGILPTTAVAHVLRYGPDPIARARLRGGGARTVPPERLKSLLAELGTTVADVEVEVPFPYLQRVEIVDTPGFNAPDPEHAKVAMATLIDSDGTGGSHVAGGVDAALWLFDANQPLKTSERRVIEAIVARGIPLLALLNKADRLDGESLAKVMHTFEDDAASIGLSPWRPALAFSAKAAVAGRVAHDDAAVVASRFPPVRALLEDELPAHGASLKERGLRRRALDLVEGMRALAERRAKESQHAASAHATRAESLRAEAAMLDRAIAIDLGASPVAGAATDERADRARRSMRDAVRGALEAFAKERDALIAPTSPTMRAWLAKRLAEHVEAGAARAAAEALAAGRPSLDAIGRDAAAIARGFSAASADAARTLDADGALARAMLATESARLRAEAAEARATVDDDAGRAAELASIVDRLR